MHKNNVFPCIINEFGEIISMKFRVLTPDLRELRRHLVENQVDAAARKRGHFYYRFSCRLTTDRKKQKMKVLVAVARKMLTAARPVDTSSSQQPAEESSTYYITARTPSRPGEALTKHVRTTLIM